MGSDGGLNGGAASFSVTGGELTFGLNLSTAGATTVTATILGDAGTADGGVIPLTTFNGSSPVVARADHLHPHHVVAQPLGVQLGRQHGGHHHPRPRARATTT